MNSSPTAARETLWSDNRILWAMAGALAVAHMLTNGQYGFHRDELATLDDARHLAWGFVAYPPLTPFLGRVSLALFGVSLRGVRTFPTLAQAACLIVSGQMAREMGGGRFAQVVAALSVATAPVALFSGVVLQYVAFDYLWWVATAYLVIRLLRSGDERWWLAVGAAVGLGMMTKYSMAFLVASLGAGFVLTGARRHLRSRWLWMGAAVSLIIFLPNLIWQIRHDFISLEFLRHIHARDVRIGRTQAFLPEQLYVATNFATLPLWITGLFALFKLQPLRLFRPLAWTFVVLLGLFVVAKGRGYYMAPAYPMLLAAGAVVLEGRLSSLSQAWSRLLRAVVLGVLAVSGLTIAAMVLPVAPVNSAWWRWANIGDFREEIGWPELVAETARVWDSLPADEKEHAAILAANYGEAGAINLYRGAFGLPQAISEVNSFWQRGYGDPPPQTLIVLGLSRSYAQEIFSSCELAGHISNRDGVKNEETSDHPDIFLCRGLREPWPEFWKKFRHFG